MFDKQQYDRERYQKNREAKLQAVKDYYLAHKDEKLAYRREYRRTHPEKENEWVRNHRRNHPEKRLARSAVERAVKAGRIVRPDLCQECQAIAPLQAHHYNGYAPEQQLDVIWLCHTCHESKKAI